MRSQYYQVIGGCVVFTQPETVIPIDKITKIVFGDSVICITWGFGSPFEVPFYISDSYNRNQILKDIFSPKELSADVLQQEVAKLKADNVSTSSILKKCMQEIAGLKSHELNHVKQKKTNDIIEEQSKYPEADIALVTEQACVSRKTAIEALEQANGDIINSIMYLTTTEPLSLRRYQRIRNKPSNTK